MLTTAERRNAMRWAYANGAMWAIGNGLASTTLVVYLARQLGAEGLAIGLILAAPPLVGCLRQFAPALIGRLASRKQFCLTCYFASGLLLAALPTLAQPGRFGSRTTSLALLVVIWCLYHLLEYLGTVALWSWLGDLAPRRIRGRFIGCRQSWLSAGRIAGMLLSGLMAYFLRPALAVEDRWMAYAIPALAGAAMMIAAVLPLLRMKETDRPTRQSNGAGLLSLFAPFRDRRFVRLLVFGCWLSATTGLTQSVQFIYPLSVLDLWLPAFLLMRIGMQSGQAAVSPLVGRMLDRYGNRPIMILSQLLVATGPLFYLAASPQQPWWIVGAWVVWIAYAGLNVALPNLMLKLSDQDNNAPHVATYFTITGLCYGLGNFAGGVVYDYLKTLPAAFAFGPIVLDHFGYLFVCGWLLRSLGVLPLLLLVEPGAWSWRRMLFRATQKAAVEPGG